MIPFEPIIDEDKFNSHPWINYIYLGTPLVYSDSKESYIFEVVDEVRGSLMPIKLVS